MKIAISGYNGLVGSHLCEYFENVINADILKISRQHLYSDANLLAKYLDDSDVIIHLAGAPVVSVWTKKQMKIIRDSRINTTRNLHEAISIMEKKPELFICASAVGIYDTTSLNTEMQFNYSNDFLGKLCQDWEREARKIEKEYVRTVIFRLGVILSDKGGILKKVLPIFRLGLGGKVGTGEQAFPYIHIADLMEAFLYVIKTKNTKGVYNLVAPEANTNADFTKILATCLKQFAFIPVPAFILKLLYRKGADVLLKGQKVVPERLKTEGFHFKYVTLESAVNSFLM